MKIKTLFDFLFSWVPVSFAILWLTQATWTIYTTGYWFGPTTLLLFGNIHTVTVFAVCPLYIILFLFFNTHLSVPMRVVTAAAITSIGIHFNGVIWSTFNLFLGSRTGMPQINAAFLFLIFVVLYALHRKLNILQVHKRFMLVATGVFLISLFWFVDSGFFQSWALYEARLIPHPHNWQWIIEKTVAVFMWIGIARRYKGKKIIE